jgi:hypothetical protein
MPRSNTILMHEARRSLGKSQNGLAAMLGVSRRTGQRWTAAGGVPFYRMTDLAKVVAPVDVALAAEIAQAAGTTLEALGVAPRPTAPAAPPPLPAHLRGRVVDAVVCSAAEAMQTTPQAVRPALLAAFACARDLGLAVDEVERVLRTRGSPDPGE